MAERKLKVVKPVVGRPPKISREQIFAEARRLGAGELNFSTLAARLGVQKTALYHRFDSREDLLNELALELAKEFSLAPGDPKRWRSWLEDTALRFFDFLVANPVILEVSNWRGLARFGIPIMESALETLTTAGHSLLDAGRAWQVVSDITYAQARLLTDISRAGPMPSQDGHSDPEAGQPVPLTRKFIASDKKKPRDQLSATLRWAVRCMPEPRT